MPRYMVTAWRQSMIRTIVLGDDLDLEAALALARERFETGAYQDVEVRVRLPWGETGLVRGLSKVGNG